VTAAFTKAPMTYLPLLRDGPPDKLPRCSATWDLRAACGSKLLQATWDGAQLRTSRCAPSPSACHASRTFPLTQEYLTTNLSQSHRRATASAPPPPPRVFTLLAPRLAPVTLCAGRWRARGATVSTCYYALRRKVARSGRSSGRLSASMFAVI
jgi:hypothetical protein